MVIFLEILENAFIELEFLLCDANINGQFRITKNMLSIPNILHACFRGRKHCFDLYIPLM